MSTLTYAINHEVEHYGDNPDYADYRDIEYACECMLSNRQTDALKRIKHLYRLLCEGYVSANYYREVVRKLAKDL